MAIGFNWVKYFSYLEQSNTVFPSILQFSLIVQDDTEFLMTLVQLHTHHEEPRLYFSWIIVSDI